MQTFRLQSVFLVYGILAAVSMLWDAFSQKNAFSAWQPFVFFSIGELIFAIVFVVAYCLLSELLALHIQWARELRGLLKKLLTPISYFQIVVIALLSGFVEEWFFRGILLNHFGLILSSLIFGLAHLIMTGKLWLWSIWSFFFGIIFGIIYQQTDSLLLVVLIHSAINAVGLYLLNQSARSEPSLSTN